MFEIKMRKIRSKNQQMSRNWVWSNEERQCIYNVQFLHPYFYCLMSAMNKSQNFQLNHKNRYRNLCPSTVYLPIQYLQVHDPKIDLDHRRLKKKFRHWKSFFFFKRKQSNKICHCTTKKKCLTFDFQKIYFQPA